MMRKVVELVSVSLVLLMLSYPIGSVAQTPNAQEHTDWIARSLKEMEIIKVGMTRRELLKIFKEEGGLSTRARQRYAYHECAYIKVDVEFEPVEDAQDKLTPHPNDRIVKISKPFLEWSITD